MDRDERLRWLGSIGIFYVAIPLFVVLSEPVYARLVPWSPVETFVPPARLAAIALIVAGAALAFRSMRDQVTTGEGHPFDLDGRQALSRPTHRLLTRGVYRWTRNPMGLGDVLLYAGLAIVADAPRSLAVNVPLYAVIVGWNHRFNERPALLARFGAAYLEYERSTSCLVPGPKSWRKWRRRAGTPRGHRAP